MSKIDDGGPAFPLIQKTVPTHFDSSDTDPPYTTVPGMSLRDFFAAQPLTDAEYDCLRLSYFHSHPGAEVVSIATIRYWHADTLIAEKRRTEGMEPK